MKDLGKDQIDIIENLYLTLLKVTDAFDQRNLIERFLIDANLPPTEHNYSLVMKALQKQEPITKWLDTIDHFPGMKVMGDENSFRFFLQDIFVARGSIYAHDVLAFLGCPRDGVAEGLVEKWCHREMTYADFLEQLDNRVQDGTLTPAGDRRTIYPMRGVHVFQCIEEGYPKVDIRLEDNSVKKIKAVFTLETIEIAPTQFLPINVDNEVVESDGVPVAFTAAVIHEARNNPLLMGRQFVFHFTSEERLVFDENGEFSYVTASQVA
jgi:hypothetical protein